ncbi:alpha/beta hydrolase [Mycobacterium sp. NPDC050441]|uniref:alpha/beta fold hydrolase n=1 Tax=Mycobacterium sp. NPDC050441 TaxID=3155403 RepID=UPI0033C1AA11
MDAAQHSDPDDATFPTLVLIHGGAHAADCWDLTIRAIRQREPRLRVIAVDLPGRGRHPGPVSAVTLSDFVNSVIGDIARANVGHVVIAAHSMGGMTAPGVAAELGHPRIAELVFIAAFVAPHGSSILDALGAPLSLLAKAAVSLKRSFPLPVTVARMLFWNGLSRDQITFARARLYTESRRVLTDAIDLHGLAEDIPRTWILTLRDRALPPRRQFRCIADLGGVDSVCEIDSCHDAMIDKPDRLAQLLISSCHRHRR